MIFWVKQNISDLVILISNLTVFRLALSRPTEPTRRLYLNLKPNTLLVLHVDVQKRIFLLNCKSNEFLHEINFCLFSLLFNSNYDSVYSLQCILKYKNEYNKYCQLLHTYEVK